MKGVRKIIVKMIEVLEGCSQKTMEVGDQTIKHQLDMKEALPKHLLVASDHETGHGNTVGREAILGIGREAGQKTEDAAAQETEIDVEVVVQGNVRGTEDDPLIDIREHHPESHRLKIVIPANLQRPLPRKLKLNVRNSLKNGVKIIARHPSKLRKS